MTPAPVTTDPADQLRRAGLRVTAQRVAVLDALARHPHASADELHREVQGSIAGIALQTVHGVVGDLTEAGLAQRVSLPGAASALYEVAAHDNHHHIQCVICGRVEDVECVVGEAPCLEPSHTHGMRVLEASVTFRAICARCERNGNG
ncbi:Fur family transcriptional regulator [Microbacterium indicum]|uniref:Fur family transcriptional regulator n=1 Tax=Microbacterium indicum TaxID=358100 RepID=UPI00056B4054|nr:Fur family transcriptional regulator [Microbacterium indicum]